MERETKLTEYFKKLIDDEQALKRVPFYMFLICTLLIVLVFKLHSIDKHLERIANDGIIYATYNDTFYEVSTAEDTQIEDYVPLIEILTEESTTYIEETITKNNNNNTTSTTTTTVTTTKSSENNDITTNNQNTQNIQNAVEKYTINIKSKKIHFADCSSAIRTKEENKQTLNLSDEELQSYIDDGYTFCKTCGGD